jgi:NAD(P)-dependent dehydrogenase (short-subunit alcohol dehydrogenase family)
VKPQGIALVTGAGRGLGRAIALELARSGFEVVAGVRDPAAGAALAAQAAAQGARLRFERLDVTDLRDVELPEGLRVLVNNAGTEREYLPLEHQPLAQWREVFETNVFGLVEITRRAIPRLKAAGGGVICNITSSSLLAPVPLYAAYRASKAAVSALGESLRAELRPWNIRVVEILPGPIDTDMLRSSDRLAEAARHPDYRAMAEQYQAGRRAVAPWITAPEEAARRIRTAILDDAGPLRWGCDPLSEQMLEDWRSARDEDLMRRILGS